jgi:uracil phosphoribosyltransferase
LDGKEAGALVSILRAGNGLLDGVLRAWCPSARVGFVGLYRDEETLEPVEYYFKVPEGFGDRRHNRSGSNVGHRQFIGCGD